MKARKIFITIAAFVLPASLAFVSCTKNDAGERGQTPLQIFLADDPGDYEEVLIDVQDIQVNLTGDNDEGWQSLDGVNTGTYDLLQLVNGHDTLLADATIPSGRIYRLRLILGPENYVKVNGTLIKLNTPAAEQSGLKLNIRQDVANGILYKILLDFDVAKSVVADDNGGYNLKPAIRTIFESVGGSLKGWVEPKDSATLIYAIQNTDTITSTRTGGDGGYMIKGVAGGSYSLYFNPSDSAYRDTIISGINVVNKEITVVDTMFLQQ